MLICKLKGHKLRPQYEMPIDNPMLEKKWYRAIYIGEICDRCGKVFLEKDLIQEVLR